MRKRCIFLDRDGVMIVDKHYIHNIEDIEFLPLAIDGLTRLQRDFELIIITNQAGVARGYFALETAQAFNQEMERRLKEQGIIIKKSYICPHHPEFIGECRCRKPKIGLAQQAAKEFGISLVESVFIGDKDSDTEFGRNCGGTTVLINNGQYPTCIVPDFTVNNLLEANDVIPSALRHKTSARNDYDND